MEKKFSSKYFPMSLRSGETEQLENSQHPLLRNRGHGAKPFAGFLKEIENVPNYHKLYIPTMFSFIALLYMFMFS